MNFTDYRGFRIEYKNGSFIIIDCNNKNCIYDSSSDYLFFQDYNEAISQAKFYIDTKLIS